LCGLLFEAKCLKCKRQVIEAGIKRKIVYLRMNALLELKFFHPRKTMNCLQPSLITSLESPSNSNCVFVIVCHEMKFKSWDLCWLLIEKLPQHLCLSETVTVRHWLDEPSLILVLLASLFHLCCLIIIAPIFEILHIFWRSCWLKALLATCVHVIEFFGTNTTLNNHCDHITWGQVNYSFFAWGQAKL